MEESRKHPEHSVPSTSPPMPISMGGGMVENRTPSHNVRMYASDKSGHAGFSSSGTMVSPPVSHVTAGSPAPLQYQSIAGQVKPPIVSGGMHSSHLGRMPSSTPLPKVDQPQFRVDGGSNGPYLLHAQGIIPCSMKLPHFLWNDGAVFSSKECLFHDSLIFIVIRIDGRACRLGFFFFICCELVLLAKC